MSGETATGATLIQAALGHLAAQNYLTIILASEDLVVTARHGPLAPEIAVSAKLCDAALPLIGLEDQIRALRRRPDRTIEMPNVAVVDAGSGGAPPPRLSYVVSWDPLARCYVCLIQRALTSNDLSLELQRQVRRRMLAEAETAAQAEAIAAANDALSRANRDLGDFARIVSHDLKSPMRALRYFAEDLERVLAQPDSGGDPLEHLGQLKAQSRRMSAMLTGLLAYVRLEDKSEAAGEVDTGALVHAIVASLPRPDGIAVVVTGVWPRVETLEAPLDLVIRNLIDNAIKHHDLDCGKIIVHCAPSDTALDITITDDGPGIPRALHAAAFKPYTRVGNDPEADSGIGMGLTLVSRAAGSVGAELTLTSDPPRQRGTQIRLLWPCAILTKP